MYRDGQDLKAMIAWIIALIAISKRPKARGFVIGASVLLLLIYVIPHSMHGSELNYSEYEAGQHVIEKILLSSNFMANK